MVLLLNKRKCCVIMKNTNSKKRKEKKTEPSSAYSSIVLFEDCKFFILQSHLSEVKNNNNSLNLYNISNYLVSLFKNFPEKYTCTPVKIQKIILVLHIYYIVMSNGEYGLPSIQNISLTHCGCKLKEVEACIPNSIIDNGKIISKKIDISEKMRKEMLNYKIENNNIFNPVFISNETKNLIIDLFSEFAGYSAKEIGDCFDPIKPNNCQYTDEFEIPIKIYNEWILEKIDYLDNLISNFVKEHI